MAFLWSLLPGTNLPHVHAENAGSEVHRAADEAGERQNGHMLGRHFAVLRAHRALVAHKIGICTAQTGGTHSLVAVDHDVMVGGTLHRVKIVVHHALAVVGVALWGRIWPT